jgi:hypothetical protein
MNEKVGWLTLDLLDLTDDRFHCMLINIETTHTFSRMPMVVDKRDDDGKR